jgi:tRNA pseudouridine55 synthase
MDGFLLIDKPAGITSHDAVDAVRRAAKTRRVGHAGTLDPFATGLLIIGINKATKKLSEYVGMDKTYEATARLGETSTTDDPEGTVVASPVGADPCVRPDLAKLTSVLAQFRGTYEQTAPAYSAKKIAGKKLYDLARAGKMVGVVLPKKMVMISELEILDYTWPELRFRTSCSSGTYIRALARDIGATLGTGAYLTQLRRTRIGTFDAKDAIPLKELKEETLMKAFRPMTS